MRVGARRFLLLLSAVSIAAAGALFALQDRAHGPLEDRLGVAWDEAALLHQPRMAVYSRQAEQYGFHPATTAWQRLGPGTVDFAIGSPAEGAVHESPGALIAAFAARVAVEGLGTEIWEVTTRAMLLDEDSSMGALLLWGFKDDALAGEDYRLTMKRADRGWYVAELERRFHCRRGITEDLCS